MEFPEYDARIFLQDMFDTRKIITEVLNSLERSAVACQISGTAFSLLCKTRPTDHLLTNPLG